jgi:CRP/FNR family transcriptional regulator
MTETGASKLPESPFELLRSLPYFEAMGEAHLQALAEQMLRRVFAGGETIFLEGDSAAGLWVIAEGSVKVYKINPEGEEHILHLLGAGSTFNDIAALDGGANPANAAALSDSVLYILPTAALNAALNSDPQLAARMVKLLAHRVRGLVGQIENLALHSVTIRLARFLLQQAADPNLSAPGVTRVTIAAHLATTPETVSRALRSLEQARAIEFDRHRIVIINEDLLRTIAAL